MTVFYIDKDLMRKFMKRQEGAVEHIYEHRYRRYIFASVEHLISFFKADSDAIVYDDEGTPWTVESLRKEIIKHGVIILGEEVK